MTGQQTRGRPGERARRLPVLAAQRALLPCAVGVWGGLLSRAAPDRLWALLPSSCLWVGLGLSLLPGAGGPTRLGRLIRGGLAAAGLAGLLYLLAPLLGLAARVAHGIGWTGWACSVSALLACTLQDRQRAESPRQRRAAILLPWLAAARLGILGGWLILQGAEGALTPAQQSWLSAATLLVVAETLLLAAWERGATPGGLRGLGQGSAWASLAGGLVWGGRLLPAVLVLLTASRESVYLALVGWVLLWLGDGLGYVLLKNAARPWQGADDRASDVSSARTET